MLTLCNFLFMKVVLVMALVLCFHGLQCLVLCFHGLQCLVLCFFPMNFQPNFIYIFLQARIKRRNKLKRILLERRRITNSSGFLCCSLLPSSPPSWQVYPATHFGSLSAPSAAHNTRVDFQPVPRVSRNRYVLISNQARKFALF